MDEPAADPRIGRVLQGRYQILSRIASGGMGVIYRAERVHLGRLVAVKFLHPWIAAKPEFLHRFEIEARAMSRLEHPQCASVIDFGVEEDAPYLVMDYVTGKTLRDVLEDGALEVTRALHIGRQILAGLAHAHHHGIVHRDIKPDNIILTEATGFGDHVRILDFGLAKLAGMDTIHAESGRSLSTGPGMALGTPSYMSPEQTRAAKVDHRTDLYSVGVVMFELLTGRRPFESEQMLELLAMHREQAPPKLRVVAPRQGFSVPLEAVLVRALAKAPDDRFQSAVEFAAALKATPEATIPTRSAVQAAVTLEELERSASGLLNLTEPAFVTGDHATVSQRIERPGMSATAVFFTLMIVAALGAGTAWWLLRPASVTPPATKLAAPAAKDPSPAAKDPSPAAKDPSPAAKDPSPVAKEPAPVAKEPAPVAKEPAPVAKEPAPVAKEPAPVAKGPAPVAKGPAPGTVSTAPSAQDLAITGEAQRLFEAKRRQSAVLLLLKLRVRHPKNAYVAYLLGNYAADILWYNESFAAYTAAIQHNPAFASDPVLIDHILSALITDRYRNRAASFVTRDIGVAAVPNLERIIATNKNRFVRERASRILAGLQGR